MSQLSELAQPFEKKLIEQKQNHDYVSHSTVTERALAILGAYSIERVELIYDEGRVTGALVTIACELDGKFVRITEAGESENPTSKTNGAKAKDAISDAVKRCWMRLGLGLHLWSQKSYFLDRALASERPPEPQRDSAPAPTPPSTAEAEQVPVEDISEPALGEAKGQVMLRDMEAAGYTGAKLSDLIVEALGGMKPVNRMTTTESGKVYALAKQRGRPPLDVPERPQRTDTLTNDEAAALHKALAAIGFSSDRHYALASHKLKRNIASLTQVTKAERDVLIDYAERAIQAERSKAA